MEPIVVTFAGTASLVCRMCARMTEFEQPPCVEGHGAECPEWYCTECGAATMVGRHWRPESQPLARATSRS